MPALAAASQGGPSYMVGFSNCSANCFSEFEPGSFYMIDFSGCSAIRFRSNSLLLTRGDTANFTGLVVGTRSGGVDNIRVEETDYNEIT